MLPPSVTEAADALSETVVLSASSLTLVATVLVVTSEEKLPPVVAVTPMVCVCVPCT